MHLLYNLLISGVEKLLPMTGRINEKMKLFVEGRKEVPTILREKLSSRDKIIWIHAASLGEFEQAVPVIEELKKDLPKHKILVTFFSPSGYEVKKNSTLVNVVTYLPIDTVKNANAFLDLTHPDLVFFVKYEFWPNFLDQLKKRNITTLLVSGSFREDQAFFRSYGKWMRRYLKSFDHFFVQNEQSRTLLRRLGFENATVSGDTRFDRVLKQLSQDNKLEFMEEFKGENPCLVAGSTWPEDEEYLLNWLEESNDNWKIVIAPHALKPARIAALKKRLGEKAILFSEKEGRELGNFKVLILNTIGLLTRVYSYADLAFVGGAVGDTGLHNVLEPAAFGVPVITGNKLGRFPEAQAMEEENALFAVSSSAAFSKIASQLSKDEAFRKRAGEKASSFIHKNAGATRHIKLFIQNVYCEKS